MIGAAWLRDLLFALVGYQPDGASDRRAKARRRLGLDILTGDRRIHETSRGGLAPQQEAEMKDEQAHEPTEADEAVAVEAAEDALEAGEELAEALDDLGDVTAEAVEAVDAAVAELMPTIVVHYLGFTYNRTKIPTGHFPTKAALLEANDGAILNKGWNIGSKDLPPDKLPEIGCHREKAKAIAAATRAAKAAAPCKLLILDSNGDEIESRTFRQKAETDSEE